MSHRDNNSVIPVTNENLRRNGLMSLSTLLLTNKSYRLPCSPLYLYFLSQLKNIKKASNAQFEMGQSSKAANSATFVLRWWVADKAKSTQGSAVQS